MYENIKLVGTTAFSHFRKSKQWQESNPRPRLESECALIALERLFYVKSISGKDKTLDGELGTP